MDATPAGALSRIPVDPMYLPDLSDDTDEISAESEEYDVAKKGPHAPDACQRDEDVTATSVALVRADGQPRSSRLTDQ
jgi:hypothetical protein